MSSDGFDPHIRPINIRHDLEAIANLIDIAFAGQMDDEGRDYLRHIRQIARGLGGYLIDGNTPETSQFPFHGYLWEENGQIIGNLTLIPVRKRDMHTYFIANVAVHPDFRGRGIARQMTERAIAHVKEHGGKRIYLQVRSDNLIAQHIYRVTGFEEVDCRTSWVCLKKCLPIVSPPPSVQVTGRKETDWSQQKEWLYAIYPNEISWNLPYNIDRLKPGVWVSINNFFNGITSRSWSAREGEHLIGVASWESGFSGSDYIWMATSPVWEDRAIRTLIPTVISRVFRPHNIIVNYPAGRGVNAFLSSGMKELNTLVWMKKDLPIVYS